MFSTQQVAMNFCMNLVCFFFLWCQMPKFLPLFVGLIGSAFLKEIATHDLMFAPYSFHCGYLWIFFGAKFAVIFPILLCNLVKMSLFCFCLYHCTFLSDFISAHSCTRSALVLFELLGIKGNLTFSYIMIFSHQA